MAKKDIILIDNYIDDSVLKILNKRANNVTATIYTAHISENLKLDLQKHNTQYQPIDIKVFKDSHDRFLIIDDDVYHIGASLKDLGTPSKRRCSCIHGRFRSRPGVNQK